MTCFVNLWRQDTVIYVRLYQNFKIRNDNGIISSQLPWSEMLKNIKLWLNQLEPLGRNLKKQVQPQRTSRSLSTVERSSSMKQEEAEFIVANPSSRATLLNGMVTTIKPILSELVELLEQNPNYQPTGLPQEWSTSSSSPKPPEDKTGVKELIQRWRQKSPAGEKEEEVFSPSPITLPPPI